MFSFEPLNRFYVESSNANLFVTKLQYIIERQSSLRETYRGSVEINQIIVNASGTSQSRSYISKALNDPPYHFELAEHSVSLTVGRGVYEQLGARIESFSFARRYCRDRINDRLCALRLVPAKCFNAIIFISGGTGADYNT